MLKTRIINQKRENLFIFHLMLMVASRINPCDLEQNYDYLNETLLIYNNLTL